MFTQDLQSKLQRLIAGLSVGGLVLAGVVAAVPASAALAAPATPPAQGQLAQTREGRLERAYQREQQWLSTQQDNLNKMNGAADKVQQFITTQQGKGKDVTALQDALATFKAQITAAQSSHTVAVNVLNTHLGFDASGKVTNAVQARQTVLDALQALRDAHNVMRQAVTDLHRAVRAWRLANGVKAQQPTVTPGS